MVSILSQSKIKEELNALSAKDRKQLMYAFNEEIAQYIELEDGYFIGVHVEGLSNLEVLVQAGSWAYGRIK